jgi:hypothetical protein
MDFEQDDDQKERFTQKCSDPILWHDISKMGTVVK